MKNTEYNNTASVLLSLLLFTVVYIGIPEVYGSGKSPAELAGTPDLPSFTKFLAEDEYPLSIHNMNYSYADFSQKKTTTLIVGEPIQIKVLASDDGGGSDIKRISLYMNLHGEKKNTFDSNTVISYVNYQEPTIINSEGIIEIFRVNSSPDGLKLLVTFDIIFAKEMRVSDIIIQVVDEVNNSAQLQAVQAIEVIKEKIVEESSQEEVEIVEPNEIIPDKVPNWIKQRTKAWVTDSATDVGFAQGLTGMINENILQIPDNRITAKNASEIVFEIPQWVKNNAKWWTEDLISETEFVNAIQFLLDNDHIKIEN